MEQLKRIFRGVPGVRTAWRLLRTVSAGRFGTPSRYRTISVDQVSDELVDAWKSKELADRQRRLVNRELERMYEGDVVAPYRILAEAVQATGAVDGRIVEVGCASGYYSEVLTHLLGRPVDYTGIDFSAELIAQARRYYPATPFAVGDACALDLPDGACDVLISGGVLAHVPDYRRAIDETARVTRQWAIFHRTPVIQRSATTYYTKLAYGVPCVELAFSEPELLGLFESAGLELVETWYVGDVGIHGMVEPEVHKTYLCRKTPQAMHTREPQLS